MPSGKWLHVCFAVEEAEEVTFQGALFGYERTIIFVYHAQEFPG